MSTVDTQLQYAKVLVSGPFSQAFDYRLETTQEGACIGARVRVPFGRREVIGMIAGISTECEYALDKIKPVLAVLDTEPLIPEDIRALQQWAANYYLHPYGDVVFATLPKLLRLGKSPTEFMPRCLQITAEGQAALAEGEVRGRLQLEALQSALTGPLPSKQVSAAVRNALLNKQWLHESNAACETACKVHNELAHDLNAEQADALAAINKADHFAAFVLAGVTGSGKTEVYLQAIAHVLSQGKSALVLVPEISLTPQTVSRFQARFDTHIVSLHSKLNDTERAQAWWQARQGQARIVIGTRSALFTPIPNLGILIIDEEHDDSFKQQSGFRYHARSLAVVRARLNNIPIVLGSATPSLEALYNVQHKGYQLLKLTERPTGVAMPTIKVVDLRCQQTRAGLTQTVVNALRAHLEAGQQVMVFLNRRGYCPVLLCHQCGYSASCPHCETRLVLHGAQQTLNCHHCGFQQRLISRCPSCQSDQLLRVGQGTERLAEYLEQTFTDYKVLRIDSDTTQRKHSFSEMLATVHDNDAQILVGTQMLAKGHHFPKLSLVVMLDADYGFYSHDFRALESLGQLLTQVAGRAGREGQNGEVYIQTHEPHHPLLQHLLQQGYLPFAEQVLLERQQSDLPPCTSLAMLTMEHTEPAKLQTLLQLLVKHVRANGVTVMGPVPAVNFKRANRYRYQLLVRSIDRRALHIYLQNCQAWLRASKSAARVKWSLDVDPIDMS